jgi:hypothetical protein
MEKKPGLIYTAEHFAEGARKLHTSRFISPAEAADIANRIHAEWLEKQQIVYGHYMGTEWHLHGEPGEPPDPSDSEYYPRARLVDIQDAAPPATAPGHPVRQP